MDKLKALVLMQLKDKLDLSFVASKKELIRKIVFTVLKFVVVGAIAYVLRLLLGLFIFQNSDTPSIMVVLLTFLMGFSIITCTIGLVKSLYLADDNRVLITFPVGNNLIFASKIIVYYFYELVKEYLFVTPILLGCGLFSIKILSAWFIPWMLIIMVFIPAVPVLLGALLSIPALYLMRIANRYPILKILGFVAVAGIVVWGVVSLIRLIPSDIDLINQGHTLVKAVRSFLLKFEKAVLPISWLVYLMVGKEKNLVYNLFDIRTLIIFVGLIVALAVLFGIVFLVSRPLFFKMMSKSFEFEKKNFAKSKLNVKHGRWSTLLTKEFKLCIMNTEVSLSFLLTYIAVPVLIYLLNKLYSAMNTRLSGVVMTYAFNILIMLLPMLASNAVISTLFSKEGRSGYMKKTKPINVLMPLLAKLFFFLVFSIPSIVATVTVFASFTGGMFKWYDIILLGGMLLGFQYGHIFFSALLDVMNPQNEQYATVGDSAKNPNENKSTIFAFAISVIVALFSNLLFSETVLTNGTVTVAMIKLFAIATVFCVAMVVLFVKCVKAYYYEK